MKSTMTETVPLRASVGLPSAALYHHLLVPKGASVADWLARWAQAQRGLGSNHRRKLFTPVVPLFNKQRNWQQYS